VAVVGSAQILVRPSFAGFQTANRRQMAAAGQSGGVAYGSGFSREAAKAQGSTFGSKAAGALKKTAAVTGAAVGGILAFSIAKGFGRLNAIEQAQAKLRGLGHDAKSIETIMVSALASVKGTAFGLDEAATAAASAVAAGIKPGKELTRYLKLTADAATIAGTSFNDMSRIINQVTTAGRAQTEDLNQLAERGIPIYQWLAEEYGVTALKLREMVTKGKVDSAVFRRVIEENIGGAALSAGDTTQGAFRNLQASLGRIGANLLSGIFPQLRGGFQAITTALGPFEDKAKIAGNAIGQIIGRAGTGLVGLYDLLVKGDYTGKLRAAFGWAEDDRAIDFLFDLREGVLAVWASFRSRDAGSLGSSFAQLRDVLRELLPPLDQLSGRLPSVERISAGFARTVDFLAEHSGLLKTALLGLAVAFGVYKAAQAANAVVGRNSVIGFGLQIAATLSLTASNFALARSQTAVATTSTAQAVATRRSAVATAAAAVASGAARAASVAWTVAQWALNAAMFANPIGLVVLAIAALVGGIILAYKHSETFRSIVQGAWSGIKVAVDATWTFLRDTVWPGIVGVFSAIGGAATGLWTKYIKPAWDGISAGFRLVGDVIRYVWDGWIWPILDLAGAIITWLAKTAFRVALSFITAQWRLMGAAIKLGYDKLLKPTIDGFWKVVNTARGLISTALGLIRTGWNLTATWVRDKYNVYVRPIVSAFGSVISLLWSTYVSPNLVKIRNLWTTMSTKIKSVYDVTIKPTIDKLKTLIGTVAGAFSTAVTAVGKAWDGLKAKAKSPINFVIDTVVNKGLIGGFNNIARKMGTTQMKTIPWPPKGWREGGSTGDLPANRIAGFVHGNEHVVEDPVVRKTPGGHKTWERLRGLVRKGNVDWIPGLAGYWLGGGVKPVPGGGNRHSGYGWARWAGDFPNPTGTAVKAYKAGVVAAVRTMTGSYGKHIRINHPSNEQTLYAHLSRFLVKSGQRVGSGQTIARVGSTGKSSGPHLHFELAGGGSKISGGGGGGGIVTRVINYVKQLQDKLKSPLAKLKELGTSPFAELAKAAARKISAGLVEKMRKTPGSIVRIITGTDGDGSTGGGSVKGGGLAGIKSAARSLGLNSWNTHRDPQGRSAIDITASGSKNSQLGELLRDNHGKLGLRYVIRRKQIASSNGGWKWRSYYRPAAGDHTHSNHVHASYERGTMHARRGLALVGERQPELINFRGGEQVAANRKQASEIFGGTGPTRIEGTLDLGNGLSGYVTGILVDESERRDTASAHRANLPV